MKNSVAYTVLIVDDHPLIIEAYKLALKNLEVNDNIVVTIKTASNLDDAVEMVNYFIRENKTLDIVFLDIRLPSSSDGKILSGEDLGLKIRKLLSDTKIIVSTTLNDNYRIHSIFKSIDPEGMLIKNDVTSKDLVKAIKNVMTDPPYYSKTVLKLLRKQINNDFLLDNIDRQLLYELSIGTKMKDLPDILPLSMAGIEKRKRNLKQIFNVEGIDDKELLIKAKEKGFI